MKDYFFQTKPDKVLIFADILGFSNLIYEQDNEDSKEGLSLNFLAEYNDLMEYIEAIKKHAPESFRFSWMSDSIVLSADKAEINFLLQCFSKIYNDFIVGGLLLRGAICVGRLYHEDNIWGQALVEAAKIEKSICDTPRILISVEDKNVLEIEEHYARYFKQAEIDDQENDTDYFYYNALDLFVDQRIDADARIVHSTVSTIKDELINGFENAKSITGPIEKWAWIINEYISILKNKRDSINEKVKKVQTERPRAQCVEVIVRELEEKIQGV